MNTFKEFLVENGYSKSVNESFSGFNFSYTIDADFKAFKKVSNADMNRYGAGIEKKGNKTVVHGQNSNSAEMVVLKAFGKDSTQYKDLKRQMMASY